MAGETRTELEVDMTAAGGAEVARRIYTVRGLNVMLDSDLAEMYGVETKVLNQAVKRNSNRFPADFMFQVTEAEAESLRSQIVTSNTGRGGQRYLPYAFTEQGVAMLSGVLRSERAVQVNIAIMRAFISLRGLMATENDLARRILTMDAKYDKQFATVFEAIRRLIETEKPAPGAAHRVSRP